MKNLKNKKGITLVALVVTIIVLLILAGVSLSLVAGGNGIITRASDSSTQSLDSSAKEQAELAISEAVAAYYTERYVNVSATTASDIRVYLAGGTGSTSTTYTLSDGSLKIEVNNSSNPTTCTATVTVTKTNHVFEASLDKNGNITSGWTLK